jgi:hypothetical protein
MPFRRAFRRCSSLLSGEDFTPQTSLRFAVPPTGMLREGRLGERGTSPPKERGTSPPKERWTSQDQLRDGETSIFSCDRSCLGTSRFFASAALRLTTILNKS